jgi:hypothetical protein
MKTTGVCVKTLVLCGGRSANRMAAVYVPAAAPAMAPVPRPPPAPGRRRPRDRPRPPRADALASSAALGLAAVDARTPRAAVLELRTGWNAQADKIFFFLMGV